jgi:hypothetical protein
MFFRVKPAKGYRYLQIARSVRRGKTVRQEIIATLGRLDLLQESGQLDSLLRSGLRYARKVKVLDAHAAGQTEQVSFRRIGPDLVFGRLWKSMGIGEIIRVAASKRRHEFDLERAVYLTVLHRLFASGSDRAAEVWKENYCIPGTESLWLHQLYRTMGWLGEEIGQGLMGSPRCAKDLIEEALFDRGRDLFSEVGLVFFDTTSIFLFCAPTPIMTPRRSPTFTKPSGWWRTRSAPPKASWTPVRSITNAMRPSAGMSFARFWLCV